MLFLRYLQQADQAVRNGGTSAGLCGREIRSKKVGIIGCGQIDGLVTDFSASSEELLASISGVMEAINEVSKAATEGASGTTDIADKTGIIVERANEIKEKAEATRIAADKLQQNVEHFIV